MFLTTAHNNACFVIAKKIMNGYDLWFNEFMNNWFYQMYDHSDNSLLIKLINYW